jgi:hypothetical protein
VAPSHALGAVVWTDFIGGATEPLTGGRTHQR